MATRSLFVALVVLGPSFSASAQLAAVDSPRIAGAAPVWSAAQPQGAWCVTYQRYLSSLAGRGINPGDAACAWDGPCDDPNERDASIPTFGTPVKTVRLSIHVFCENNGGNRAATPADVDAAVARLNADYAPWRIQFVYQLNFINSTRYRYLDPYSEERGMKNAYADSPATKLNMYVVSTGGNNWGTFPWDPDSLSAQGGIVFNGSSALAGHIITHEVGHCLGLWHTFHGVTEVTQCGDCYEAAGRSPEDGDITGDRCSDTNPTTNSGFCGDPGAVDPCSGLPWLSTPYLNFMGYSLSCASEFSAQQAGRMHCWTANVLSGWLQLPMPPAAPGAPALTRLNGGQVQATWADNSSDEDGFRVQRETKSGGSWVNTQIIATVGANTTSAIDAPGAGTFHYRVQAFSGVGDSAWSGWTQIKN